MTKQEYTLIECLKWFGIPKLPEAKRYILYSAAVVRVLKTDGKEYFAVQTSDSNGNLAIKKDFEESHSIVSIVETYPIDRFYMKAGMKSMDSMTRGDKLLWLMSCRYSFVPGMSELDGLDDAGIDLMCSRVLRLDSWRELSGSLGMRRAGFSLKSQEQSLAEAREAMESDSLSEDARKAAEAREASVSRRTQQKTKKERRVVKRKDM